MQQLYEGKAKKVFATSNPELVIVDYKDDATAGDGAKKGTIRGKGVVNNKLSNALMQKLEKQGVPTHFVQELSDRETLVKRWRSCRWRSSSATWPRAALPSAWACPRALF